MCFGQNIYLKYVCYMCVWSVRVCLDVLTWSNLLDSWLDDFLQRCSRSTCAKLIAESILLTMNLSLILCVGHT